MPGAIRDQHKWIEGLSVTEMEIIHAAYRNDNPNGTWNLKINDWLIVGQEVRPIDICASFTLSVPITRNLYLGHGYQETARP